MTTGIQGLIASLKGGRSYARLAEDCGGHPTGARIQQMAVGNLTVFPSPESIRGLAQGLGVGTGAVVQACAVTLGLAGEQGQGDPVMLPDIAETLTADQRRLVVSLVRELAKVPRGAPGHGATGRLRAVDIAV